MEHSKNDRVPASMENWRLNRRERRGDRRVATAPAPNVTADNSRSVCNYCNKGSIALVHSPFSIVHSIVLITMDYRLNAMDQCIRL